MDFLFYTFPYFQVCITFVIRVTRNETSTGGGINSDLSTKKTEVERKDIKITLRRRRNVTIDYTEIIPRNSDYQGIL